MGQRWPQQSYTDFDKNLICGETSTFIEEHSSLCSATPQRQNKNRLVECNWAVITQITQDILADMKIPKLFWFWSLKHAIIIKSYLLVLVDGHITSSFELSHGVKIDYRKLFHLFSTGYFEHAKDSTRQWQNIEAQTIAGTSIGRWNCRDSMLF